MATLVFHVLVVEKVGWKGGSREARWKVGLWWKEEGKLLQIVVFFRRDLQM